MTLTYLNEDDKAYGLAGMAISLAALDAIDRVAGVSRLRRPDGHVLSSVLFFRFAVNFPENYLG